jgi:hypothetical protein
MKNFLGDIVKNFSPFSRHNKRSPQHRGVASGGSIPTSQGKARSPKHGGLALDGSDPYERPHVAARPTTPDYASMTVRALRSDAKERGYRGLSRLRKAELVSLLVEDDS